MSLTPRQKKTALGVGLGILFLASLSHAKGRGKVIIGPVTVTNEKLNLDALTDAQAKRMALAIPEAKRMMGADPNTLVSRNPSASERTFISEVIELGRVLSTRTTYVPYPTALEKMLSLSMMLPADNLQRTNSELYRLLGVSPSGDNSATLPLSAAGESKARELVARWRPYSQDAVDTLYVLVDEARELGGLA